MIKTAEVRGLRCVTAEINTKLKKPALTGEKYSVQGKVLDIKGKIVLCEGKITDSSDRTVANSTAKLFTVD